MTPGRRDGSMRGAGFVASLAGGPEEMAPGAVTHPVPAEFPRDEQAS